MTNGCRRRQVADGKTCSVSTCDHGIVHVNLGAISLRVNARQLRETVDTLQEALLALESEPAAEPRPRLLM